MLIGRSGSGKSPLINKLLHYVLAKQAEEISRHEKERLEYEKSIQEHKLRLKSVMAGSPRGVLTHSDELSGFIRSHDQYKIKGSDRQKYSDLNHL